MNQAKATKHGGLRPGAGRRPLEDHEKKKPRTFSLSDDDMSNLKALHRFFEYIDHKSETREHRKMSNSEVLARGLDLLWWLTTDPGKTLSKESNERMEQVAEIHT